MECEYNKDFESLVAFNRKFNYGAGTLQRKRARGSRSIAYPFGPGTSGGPKRYLDHPEPNSAPSPSTRMIYIPYFLV